MKIRFCLASIALLGLVLFAGAGCSKKSTSSMPPGATQVKVEDKSTYQEPAPAAPVEPQVDERALAAEAKAQAVEELSFTINFAFDSYELNDEARATLKRKADLMKQYGDLTMIIEGYCDDRGTEEYNLALGERRARAAFEHMVILGVAPERISVVSFGEERPVDPAQNEAAWAKNRRDEFKISY